jgi:hypothetical protein
MAFDAPRAQGAWNEDGNYFITTMADRGLRYNGVIFSVDVQAYRVASGQGSHTNLASGFTTDVALQDPEGGDLRLPNGSPLVDAGVSVPNIADRPGIDYQGAGPDVGSQRR